MIKDIDLRIGNLVSENVLGICNVVCLFEICAWLNPLNPPENKLRPVYSIQYENINPIELAEEWLIKLGFTKSSYEAGYVLGEEDKKSEKCDEYSLSKLSIMDWGNGFILSNSFSFDLRVEIKSVHQLQNLIFALTGKELKATL
jgi:hypothetical protein